METSGHSAQNTKLSSLLPPSLRSAGVLTVANTLAYPPFEYVGSDGNPAGLDVELAYDLGKVLGLQVKIVKTPFVTEIPSLADGRFDMAMAPFTDTAARRAQVNFVDWLKAGVVVSVTTANPKKISGFGSLCGVIVGVEQGSFAATFVPSTIAGQCKRSGLPAPKVEILPDQPSLVLGLTTGRVDARVDDSTTSAYYAKQSSGQVHDVGTVEGITLEGFAVAKNNPDLLKALQAALTELIANGTYSTLLASYSEQKNAVSTATANADQGTS